MSDIDKNKVSTTSHFTGKASLSDGSVHHKGSRYEAQQKITAETMVASTDVVNNNTQDQKIIQHTHRRQTDGINGDTVNKGLNVAKPAAISSCHIYDEQQSADSKYDLPLKMKQGVNHRNELSTCSTLRLWDSQTKFKFGYIPLGDLDLWISNPKHSM